MQNTVAATVDSVGFLPRLAITKTTKARTTTVPASAMVVWSKANFSDTFMVNVDLLGRIIPDFSKKTLASYLPGLPARIFRVNCPIES